MLAKIRAARDGLRKSEQKVADVILEDPDGSVQSSIQSIAAKSSVSEPTVIRFCRALDCVGFQQFKLRLAQDLASRGTFFYKDVTAEDSSKVLSNKIIDGTIASMMQMKNQFNDIALDNAIKLYDACERIEFHGSGGDEKTLMVAISHSGRSSDILSAVDIAKKSRAKVVSVTATKSPLAETSDVHLSVDLIEDSDIFSPVKSRIGQMLVLDILAVGIAVRGGEEMLQQLARARRAIDSRFVKPRS